MGISRDQFIAVVNLDHVAIGGVVLLRNNHANSRCKNR